MEIWRQDYFQQEETAADNTKDESGSGVIGNDTSSGGKRQKKIRSGMILRWIWMGAVISLVLSIVFVLLYNMFRARAQSYVENPVESEENLKWIYRNNQILYRDLYNKVNHTDLSYSELFYPLTPEGRELWDMQEEDIDWEVQENQDRMNLSGIIKEGISEIEGYYNELNSQFSNLNGTYDYLIRDTKTGNIITNTASKEKLLPQDYYFYISFVYDANGNITVGDEVKGENSDKIRRLANEVIRNMNMGEDSPFIENYSYYQEINSYTDRHSPVDCVVYYGITQSMWTQLQSSLYSDNYNLWWNSYQGFVYAGCGQYFMIFCLVIFALGIFLPWAGKGSPWKQMKICRLPLEVLAGIGILLSSMGSMVITFAVQVSSYRAVDNLNRFLQHYELAEVLVYGGNLLFLSVLFWGWWYLGICIRGTREAGIWEFIKMRSLVYRFFPFIRMKCLEAYYTLVHFNVTMNAKKTIMKIVLWNAVILFGISSLWVGGFALTVVYSLILYFILKKYVSDLQKKYSILLSATNEIAQGNLNVCITEDLGVFEPFKPQVIRIQHGFRNAVEEEVKSQRMKAELITNVSHDLKTPLTAIITYIGLLKDDSITPQQRQEYLHTLEIKSNRLKVLIEDLFEVSKATSRAVTLNIMDVDIMNLVKQVELEMSDKLAASRLDVRMNLTDERIILPMDSQKTYRIYENLFGNIAKYALPGTRVYINGFRLDDTVVITLKNITAQEINVNPEELTDRFVRGDVSRNTEGSGLGLAIAKSFTELQNGKLVLELDGDLFKATTIWKITAPFADQSES